MPGFVGAVFIQSIGSSSVVNVGDVFLIRPISNSKTYAGAGSFNTGEVIRIANHYSATNTYDPDGMDQSIMFTL